MDSNSSKQHAHLTIIFDTSEERQDTKQRISCEIGILIIEICHTTLRLLIQSKDTKYTHFSNISKGEAFARTKVTPACALLQIRDKGMPHRLISSSSLTLSFLVAWCINTLSQSSSSSPVVIGSSLIDSTLFVEQGSRCSEFRFLFPILMTRQHIIQ